MLQAGEALDLGDLVAAQHQQLQVGQAIQVLDDFDLVELQPQYLQVNQVSEIANLVDKVVALITDGLPRESSFKLVSLLRFSILSILF